MNTLDARTRLQAEQARLREVQAAAGRIHTAVSNSDGEDLLPDSLPAERATETIEREIDESVAMHAAEELSEVEAALGRLEDGTYGTCELCGKPIAEGRLEILPATRYCVEDAARAR
jgi:DnaK suppressor protein